jgi:leucyl-tRNA synthetase
MRDLGLVEHAFDEPFANLLTQGMVVAPTFYREDSPGQEAVDQPGRRRCRATNAAAPAAPR